MLTDLLNRNKKNIIGLDIGTSSVKLAKLQKKRGSYQLKNLQIAPLPEDAIIEGEIVDHNAVVEAIESLISESKIKVSGVSTSIAGASVIIKRVQTQKAEPLVMDDQVYWEAEQYVPFDMSEISLDYEILQDNLPDNKCEILLVAAKKEFIEKRLSAVRELGLEPQVLDVDSLAIGNLFWENYEIPDSTSVMLIDLGASITKINIITNSKTIFTRDIAIGGKAITKEIQNQLGLSYQDAENLKIDASATGQFPSEVIDPINKIIENIVLEARRSLDFAISASEDFPITDVFVCGGNCMMPGILDLVQEMLGLPTQILNPFERISFDSSEFNEEFLNAVGVSSALAIGLALREFD